MAIVSASDGQRPVAARGAEADMRAEADHRLAFTAESDEGRSTTCTVHLPLAVATVDANLRQ
jgi:hypothetical protein